jgi:hypothetical protein
MTNHVEMPTLRELSVDELDAVSGGNLWWWVQPAVALGGTVVVAYIKFFYSPSTECPTAAC